MRFFKMESASGIVLLLAALLAVVIANSPLSAIYHQALEFQAGPFSVSEWINDGLMAFFFFVVGLEIKAELTDGELSTRDRAVLPVIGAVGGMIAPVLVYFCFTTNRGWGIPMATDIAFAVGVLSLFRVRSSLKVFLLALAIVDDLGAVLVIALFYTSKIQIWSLLASVLVGAFAAWVAAGGFRVKWRAGAFFVSALLFWWLVHDSGIHATIAGALLGFMVKEPRSLSHRLHALSSFVVMPIFALANAGVSIGDFFVTTPLINAVSIGLLVGKPVGIVSASWLALRSGFARMDFSPRELIGAACLGGIGFTMSIFIATLAFSGESLELAKLGIVRGSLLSAVLGAGLLAMTKMKRRSGSHR